MHPGFVVREVFLCRHPIDFRKGIGGLSAMVEQEFGGNVFGEALYAFVNRRRDRLKILYWDRNGFCLWIKRLESDRFYWPDFHASGATVSLSAEQLRWLLDGYDLWAQKPHQKLNYTRAS